MILPGQPRAALTVASKTHEADTGIIPRIDTAALLSDLSRKGRNVNQIRADK